MNLINAEILVISEFFSSFFTLVLHFSLPVYFSFTHEMQIQKSLWNCIEAYVYLNIRHDWKEEYVVRSVYSHFPYYPKRAFFDVIRESSHRMWTAQTLT